MTEKECLNLVKAEYPESHPIVVAEIGNLYYVDLHINDMADFHTVNKVTKKVSGNIPTVSILENEEISIQIEQRIRGQKKKMNS